MSEYGPEQEFQLEFEYPAKTSPQDLLQIRDQEAEDLTGYVCEVVAGHGVISKVKPGDPDTKIGTVWMMTTTTKTKA